VFATFYTRRGSVTGQGVATMQFGTVGGDGDFTQLKLRGGDASRCLQADEATSGDFGADFEIASNDSFQSTSGASSSIDRTCCCRDDAINTGHAVQTVEQAILLEFM
jgi:hypothetical protein